MPQNKVQVCLYGDMKRDSVWQEDTSTHVNASCISTGCVLVVVSVVSVSVSVEDPRSGRGSLPHL